MSHFTLSSIFFSVGLFVGMLALLEFGQRLGRRRLQADPEYGRAGLGSIEGAVFALLGLLVAFTFSGAASRFDARRDLVLQEANAIGTAWLRLDLLPTASRAELRDSFRRYLDARLAIYEKLPDLEAAKTELGRANQLQGEIWSRAVAACAQAPVSTVGQVIPALNEMFDITTTRTAATNNHPPPIIHGMLASLALLAALLAGFAMAEGKRRSWIHMLGFALTMAMTVYVILDLEYPRFGLIRVDAADRLLYELRESMK